MVRTKPAKERPVQTLDELAQSSFNILKNQAQNRRKLEDGDITEEDLWAQAYKRAEERRVEQFQQGRIDEKGNLALLEKVAKFRKDQEKKYRNAYEWNTSNDEATLNHILDTEANIYEIRLLLEPDAGKGAAERQKLMDQHSKLSDKHKDFLTAAGIDRLSREKKKATNEPFEDWMRIKRLGDEKMEKLKEDFINSARQSKDEFGLRNALKYHFGYEFEIVDAILLQHRRILGLPMKLDEESGAK